MVVKTLLAFTEYDNGSFFSPSVGSIVTTTDQKATEWIENGLAVEYTLIDPTGNIEITENDTGIDVAQYATATVNVGTYTVSYNANGGTGTIDDDVVIAGNTVSLPDGSAITPPTDKSFDGWATTAEAEEPDVGPEVYKPTANTTLYAVYS